METIDDLLLRHPFFEGLKPEYLALIAGCGQNVHFDAGAYLLREGAPADRFFAIRGGSIAIETYAPSRGPVPTRSSRLWRDDWSASNGPGGAARSSGAVGAPLGNGNT